MQEQFTYRELSEKLKINLAKLKRWGREFLPPDYSAGQSQGVARLLTIDEAFTVFLGGFIVNNFGYSIPDARRIIDEIKPVLVEKKLLPSLINDIGDQWWSILIHYDYRQHDFFYTFKGIISRDVEHRPDDPFKIDGKNVFRRYMIKESYIEEFYSPDGANRGHDYCNTDQSIWLHIQETLMTFFIKIDEEKIFEKLESHGLKNWTYREV